MLPMRVNAKGFTLVEMVIVIVVMAIAVTGITASLFPLGRQSVEQIAAVKAAELGRAVMDEVVGRNFDEKSGPYGGLPECIPKTVADAESCTLPNQLGTDGELTKSAYNDVDDFHGLSGLATDVLDNTLSDGYNGYYIDIQVFYEQDSSGTMLGQVSNVATNYKRINVVITDRQGNKYPFATTRGNF